MGTKQGLNCQYLGIEANAPNICIKCRVDFSSRRCGEKFPGRCLPGPDRRQDRREHRAVPASPAADKLCRSRNERSGRFFLPTTGSDKPDDDEQRPARCQFGRTRTPSLPAIRTSSSSSMHRLMLMPRQWLLVSSRASRHAARRSLLLSPFSSAQLCLPATAVL